jgi:hypothetical protein
VHVLGTPAEEGGGGKILMLEQGAFDGLRAAMMVHPAAVEMAAMPGLAVTQFDVAYRGKPAHAGAYPELGVNAADAMTLAQVGIGLLRQQTAAADRIHGISTEAGTAANIIPDVSRGAGSCARKAWTPCSRWPAACITRTADRAVLDGATAMAWTAIDIALDAVNRPRAATVTG